MTRISRALLAIAALIAALVVALIMPSVWRDCRAQGLSKVTCLALVTR